MAAVFTPGVLCVCIHRQSFYCGDKKMDFHNLLLALALWSPYSQDKWIRFDCASHILIEALLQTLIAATNFANYIVQTSYSAWTEGKFKLPRKTHYYITYCRLLSTSSCSGPPNQLAQSWSSVNSLWAGNHAGPKCSPGARDILVSSGLVQSAHYRKWFLLLLSAFLWKNYI